MSRSSGLAVRQLLFCPLVLLLSLVAASASAQWEEGVAAFRARDFSQAATFFQQVVDQRSDSPQAHYMLGLSLERLGRKEDALRHVRAAYDLNPADVSTKAALIRGYFGLGRYSDAAQLAETLDVSRLPLAQRIAMLRMRANAFQRSGDDQRAFRDYQELARNSPSDAQVHFVLGTLALSLDQFSVAKTALEKALVLEPGHQPSRRTLVMALLRMGRGERERASREELYRQAADLAAELVTPSSSYEELILVTEVRLAADRFEEAAASAEQAASKNAQSWQAQLYRGQATASLERFEEAESALQRALSLANGPREQSQIWSQLAWVHEKQKKWAEAIESYRAAGDEAGAQRALDSQETERTNQSAEAENARTDAMREEEERLRRELEALESGGDPPNRR